MCTKLARYVCHGLEALCTFNHPSLTSCGMSYFLIPYSLWPTPFRGLVLLDCGLFFLQPTLLLLSALLPSFPAISLCYSYCDVIWPKPTRPFWAFYLFFFQWLSMVIGPFDYITYKLLCPIYFLLGILGPFTFLGHPQPFLIMRFHGLLLTPLGFPSPITLSFILGAHGLSINPLLSLLALLRACCGPFSLFYIIYCPWICYFSPSGLL